MYSSVSILARFSLSCLNIFILFSFSTLALADLNVTVEDRQIPWPVQPPLWSGTNASCSKQGQAHFAFQPGMAVSYNFTGTAIYMRILRTNVTGTYTVSVDGSPPLLLDGYRDTAICDVQFGRDGLALAQHTVTATLFGRSPQFKPVRPADFTSGAYLEIDAFIYTIPDGSGTSISTSSTSALVSAPPSESPTSLTANATPALKAPAIAGIIIAIISTIFVLVAIAICLRRRSDRSVDSDGFNQYPNMPESNVASHITPFAPARSTAPEIYPYQSPAPNLPQMNMPAIVPFVHSRGDSAVTTQTSPHTSQSPSRPRKGSMPHQQNSSLSNFPIQDLAAEVAALINVQNQNNTLRPAWHGSEHEDEAPPVYEPARKGSS